MSIDYFPASPDAPLAGQQRHIISGLSSALPASATAGQLLYETDTGVVKYWTGTAWKYLNQPRGHFDRITVGEPSTPQTDGIYIGGSNAALWLKERDALVDWAIYSSGSKMRLNGAGTDILFINRSPISVSVEGGPLLSGSAHMATWRNNPAYATFGHKDRADTSSDYSFLSQDSGATYVNATVSGLVRLRVGNVDKAIIDNSGVDAVGGRVKSTEGHFGTLRNHAANGACTIICINNGNGWRPQWDGTLRFYIESTNVKNFIIPHPMLPDEKYLVHTTLEGPENAVFYRGVGELVDGKVTIELPEYFEELCAEEGRSVQLTCIADDAEDEWCPVLHATYPREGKFHVGLGSGMNIPDQRFWWEVKAIRKDVEPLLVEPSVNDIEVLGSGPYTYYKRKSGKRAATARVARKSWPESIVNPKRSRAGRHPTHPEVLEGPTEDEH